MNATNSELNNQEFEKLQLHIKMRSGEYCAARVGVTLTFFYAKAMQELVEVVKTLLDLYQAFISPKAIRSLINLSGTGKTYSKQGLDTLFRHLAREKTDYSSINLSSGEPGHVGDYGFQFYGSDLKNEDIHPFEACCCIMEFPVDVLAPHQRKRFEEFTTTIAEVAPFESGSAGYSFKHLGLMWRGQAMPWIAQQALHYLAVDISNHCFDNVARRRLVNVNWLTLIGQQVCEDLGGEARIREQLSPEIIMQPLRYGVLLIAGDTPPVGDVQQGLQDIKWLKEMAAFTKYVRARMELGFGNSTFRRTWINRFD